jgi:hypothetical protein
VQIEQIEISDRLPVLTGNIILIKPTGIVNGRVLIVDIYYAVKKSAHNHVDS